MLRLSQGLLSLLETCPRKFQYSVLEQLAPPPAETQQNSLDWGNRFHLLMQQSQLQLPLNALLSGQDSMRQAFEALHQANPQLLLPHPEAQYDSEHLRSLSFAGHSFSTVYDLLIREPDQAQILDWKTYPKPLATQLLAEHWQTKLYCFVLAETSGYRPEQISMTYWFVRGQDKRGQDKQGETHNSPESLRIAYNQAQHEDVAESLHSLINQLNAWVKQYRRGDALPQVPLAQGKCDRCNFLKRCRGDRTQEGDSWGMVDLAAIAEVIP